MPKTQRTRSIVLAAATALALSAAPLSAAERIRPGQWEYTIVHPGGEPNVVKVCISAEQAASINGNTQTARAYAEKKAAGRCTITAYDVKGDTMSYALTCGDVLLRSKTVFHGDTSEGDETSKKGSAPEVVSHIKARRLGECP